MISVCAHRNLLHESAIGFCTLNLYFQIYIYAHIHIQGKFENTEQSRIFILKTLLLYN